MFNELKSAASYYYNERYDTLFFFTIMVLSWFLVVPWVGGSAATLVALIWPLAMWYGGRHASRLEQAKSLNRNQNNWKV